MSSFTTHHLEFPGGSIGIMEAGEGEPLLMLHGAGGADSWLPAYDLLAQHFRLLVPNHPGFGLSDTLPGMDAVDDLAFYYETLLDRLGLSEKINVVGISFGGWIAAELAVLAPHRIKKMVLVNPIGLRVEGAPIVDTFGLNPDMVIPMMFKDPAVAEGLFPMEPDLDFLVKLYRDESSFANFAWAPFCNNPKLPRRLYRVTAETLLLVSADDAVVPRAHGERYVELLPNARLESISDAGHALLIEKPRESCASIVQFLNV